MNLQALTHLRDIEGVYGSFVVDRDGRLFARDLPAVFDDNALGDSGPRIVRLWEVVSEDEAPEYTLSEFSEYWLFIRPVPSGTLCVVVPPRVNVSALRMAAALAAKRLNLDTPVEPSPPPPPVAAPLFQPPIFPPGMDQGPGALKKTLFWGRRKN
jgi:predicted regulator of Ras-like GTPase activity (Roadblock/LC7/MglB family)